MMYRPSSAASSAIRASFRAWEKARSLIVRPRCFGDVVLVDDPADAHADRVRAGQGARREPGAKLGQAALGGGQRVLARESAFLGQVRISTRHQALARVVRRGAFERVALVEQIEL